MSRELKFVDSDRKLICEAIDLIETNADRAEVDYWTQILHENEGETNSHVLRMQARQHLRMFKEKRKARK